MSPVPSGLTSAPTSLVHVAVREWLDEQLVDVDPRPLVAVRFPKEYEPSTAAVRIPPCYGTAAAGMPTGDALVKAHCYAGDDAAAAILAAIVADRFHNLDHVRLPAYGLHLVAAHGLSTLPEPDPTLNPGGSPADRYIVSAYVTVGPIPTA